MRKFLSTARKATIGIIGMQPSEVAKFNVELVKQANAMGLDNDQKIPEVLAIGINCSEKKYFIEMAELCVAFGCDFVVSPERLGDSRLDQIVRDNTGVSVLFPQKNSIEDFAQNILSKACNTSNIRRPELCFSNDDVVQQKKIIDNLALDESLRSRRIDYRIKNFGQYSVFKNNPFVGVIGGAGPWASAELCMSLSRQAVNFCHFSVNSAPGKHLFEMGQGPSYINHYSNAVSFFNKIGTKFFVIPCNTAHMRLEEFMGKDVSKVIDIRQAVLSQNKSVDGFILLGTNRTVGVDLPEDQADGIYEQWCKKNAKSNSFYVPSSEQQKVIMEAIFDVKAGRVDEAKNKINQIVSEIREKYNNPTLLVILGCTELPLPYPKSELVVNNYIDPSELLAEYVKNKISKVNGKEPKPSSSAYSPSASKFDQRKSGKNVQGRQ